jgi:NAD(P)-dependent dehydrogenase (short-subunit alcohol dehydrogenase family)
MRHWSGRPEEEAKAVAAPFLIFGGIGEALAWRLATQGVPLVLSARSEAKLSALAEGLGAAYEANTCRCGNETGDLAERIRLQPQSLRCVRPRLLAPSAIVPAMMRINAPIPHVASR